MPWAGPANNRILKGNGWGARAPYFGVAATPRDGVERSMFMRVGGVLADEDRGLWTEDVGNAEGLFDNLDVIRDA